MGDIQATKSKVSSIASRIAVLEEKHLVCDDFNKSRSVLEVSCLQGGDLSDCFQTVVPVSVVQFAVQFSAVHCARVQLHSTRDLDSDWPPLSILLKKKCPTSSCDFTSCSLSHARTVQPIVVPQARLKLPVITAYQAEIQSTLPLRRSLVPAKLCTCT